MAQEVKNRAERRSRPSSNPAVHGTESAASLTPARPRVGLLHYLTAGERIIHQEAKVFRQPLANRLVHWGVALSAFLLFFSGFGQMPLYKRYMLADLPGMAWTADYGVTLALHYLGAMVLILVSSFHVAYHGVRGELGFLPRRGDFKQSLLIIRAMVLGGQEPPSEKYLAEQRLAYAVIAGNVAVLIVTGMVKVAKNLQGVSPDSIILVVSTHLHNLSMLLLLLAIASHLVAFVIPANRRLIPGMFHGKVDLAYVKHRHPLWHQRLAPRGPVALQPRPIRGGYGEQ